MCRLQEGYGFKWGKWYQAGFRIFKQRQLADYVPFTPERKETPASISYFIHVLPVLLSHPWVLRLSVRE